MPLPPFNEQGDLPPGRHQASLAEVIDRFGGQTPQRQKVTERLRRIHELALATGDLERLVIFGSYVSDVGKPNDVDVILIMEDRFAVERCPSASAILFDHARASEALGASIFWIRQELLLGESIEDFLAHWERKRDGQRRGIVEIRP